MALLNFLNNAFSLESSTIQKILQDTGGKVPAQIYAYIPRDQFFYPALYPNVNTQAVQGQSVPIQPGSQSTGLISPPATSNVTYQQALQFADAIQNPVKLAVQKASPANCNTAMKAMAQQAYQKAYDTVQSVYAGQYGQTMALGQQALALAEQVLAGTC